MPSYQLIMFLKCMVAKLGQLQLYNEEDIDEQEDIVDDMNTLI